MGEKWNKIASGAKKAVPQPEHLDYLKRMGEGLVGVLAVAITLAGMVKTLRGGSGSEPPTAGT